MHHYQCLSVIPNVMEKLILRTLGQQIVKSIKIQNQRNQIPLDQHLDTAVYMRSDVFKNTFFLFNSMTFMMLIKWTKNKPMLDF